MAPNRHAITALPQRRELLGALLEARRRNLGYATRPSFERERQVPGWIIVAIERATQRSIDPARLRFLARAYGFTYESALAVLNGEADELALIPPGPLPAPAAAPKRKRRAATRKHHAAGTAVPPGPRPIEKAPLETRLLLGVLLAQRRAELGYTHVPAFVRARLPLTEKGNPNTRLAADIEKAYRDNFPEPRLRQLARAYLVDYDSLVAVAHGRARALVPVSPAAPPAVPSAPAGGAWLPPFSDPARIAAARPYQDRIRARLNHLSAQGITDPDGVQVFGPGPDASTWDGTAGRWDLDERVWMIADMQRRDGGRDGGNSATG